MTDIPYLSAAQLRDIPIPPATGPRPRCCAHLKAAGWESLPASFQERELRVLGTLRDRQSLDPPTIEEFHPARTGFWSADAPIAPNYFPYNQSELWQCVVCARPFLRYTESGGYYHEDRIREFDPELVIDQPPP
ncbi:hypothetical protein [Xylophilus sp. GOD-11R]|uniref:hypothetical protein n=1 Tax=Xylophilus sp. GOD-11R TaxID=3089814 RepID=UPI00298D19B4|nr:hypothetical protein [Xylophilus sp. GOD-11R]WPB55161.1 hypothetical protein R9X41_13440 [Xylophilus sp. GOD-11R]